ncbi:MAG: Gfo/Idh/MocA family oxidoreductase [Alphaproteobacteria bacterium]|nr:Gfo/Idh/MocA family oxidoreductase [Alphaproteobacteria bacterium]MCB9930898.1 Gfo/Idh/MocA family oxidoreductase [Alphaproteobacteria bacterium]
MLVRLHAALIDAATVPPVAPDAGGSEAENGRVESIGVRRHWERALGVDAPGLSPLRLGAVGEVVRVGANWTERFAPGDRVVGAVAHFAGDLEWASLDAAEAAKVPDSLSDSHAAVAPLLVQAVRAVRMLQPTFGASAAVVGLAGMGLLALQCLLLAGARVLAVDSDASLLASALDLGAATVWQPAGEGDGDAEIGRPAPERSGEPPAVCSGVLLAAEPDDAKAVEQAIAAAAPDARLVAVGACPETVPFAAFMAKRLTMAVAEALSGDDSLAEDLLLALSLLDEGRVRLAPLAMAHTVLSQVPSLAEAADRPRWLAVEFRDAAFDAATPSSVTTLHRSGGRLAPGACAIGVIGTGRKARATVLPRLRALSEATLHTVLADAGRGHEDLRRRFGFERVVTEPAAVLRTKGVSLVLLLDRYAHDIDLICAALLAGKVVLTEEPFAAGHRALERVLRAQMESAGVLQVGLHRRFAPIVHDALSLLDGRGGRRHVIIRANTGRTMADAASSQEADAGDETGEADEPEFRAVLPADLGHFVDLARHLAGAPITAVEAASPAGSARFDDIAVQLHFADGSLATLAFTRFGDTAFSRETVDVFTDGLMLRLDNSRELLVVEGEDSQRRRCVQDRGHRAMLAAIAGAMIEGDAPPIPLDSQTNTLRALLALLQALKTGRRITLG